MPRAVQVHIAEGAEEDVRPGRLPQVTTEQRRPNEDGVYINEDEPVDHVGHIFESLSRVYGFAFLLVLCSILFVLALCFPEYTAWPVGGGASPLTSASNETGTNKDKTGVPTVNRSAWSMFTGFIFPSVVALRTMFATLTGDPHPLPGKGRFSWKYAPQYVFRVALPNALRSLAVVMANLFFFAFTL